MRITKLGVLTTAARSWRAGPSKPSEAVSILEYRHGIEKYRASVQLNESIEVNGPAQASVLQLECKIAPLHLDNSSSNLLQQENLQRR